MPNPQLLRDVPDCFAGDLPRRLGIESLWGRGPQEDDRTISLQVRLINAIAVNGLPHPIAADDRDDDAHKVLCALQCKQGIICCAVKIAALLERETCKIRDHRSPFFGALDLGLKQVIGMLQNSDLTALNKDDHKTDGGPEHATQHGCSATHGINPRLDLPCGQPLH